jgi:hypothetical protein
MQYVLVLLFIVSYSLTLNVSILKHTLWLLYQVAMVWTLLQNYRTAHQLNLLQLAILLFILVVMQGSQAYLLAH